MILAPNRAILSVLKIFLSKTPNVVAFLSNFLDSRVYLLSSDRIFHVYSSQIPNPQIRQAITYHVDGYSKGRLMKLGKNAKK